MELVFRGWANKRGLTLKAKTQDKIGLSGKPIWLA